VRFLFINGRIQLDNANKVIAITEILSINLNFSKPSGVKSITLHEKLTITGISVSIPQIVPIEYKNSSLSLQDK
jgi:hypothetical protein